MLALLGLLMPGSFASELHGTWMYANPMWGETITLVFQPDGTGSIDGERMRYSHQGTQLQVDADGERLVYTVRVDGDRLIASDGDLDGTLTFVRQGARPAAPTPTPAAPPASTAPSATPVPTAAPTPAAGGAGSGIVGTWTDGQGQIVFHADGSCDYVGQRVRYAYDGKVLEVIGPGGTARMDVTIDGDRLVMNAQGQSQTLTRAKPGQAPVGTANAVAGVYVGSEGTMNTSHALSITQYLTLWPDGTVSWSKSELGASNVQVSDNLARFSSFQTNPSGKGRTIGTWQAGADGSVVVQWQVWNNLRSQGRFDAASGTLQLTGMGILDEGSTVRYQRQR